jgi:hypothetical protein
MTNHEESTLIQPPTCPNIGVHLPGPLPKSLVSAARAQRIVPPELRITPHVSRTCRGEVMHPKLTLVIGLSG